MLVITIYSLVVGSVLGYQNSLKGELEKALRKARDYKDISKTAEKCSLAYLHGPAVKIRPRYSVPTNVEDQELFLSDRETRARAKTFSPGVSSVEGGITCASTRSWYLKEVK